MYLTLSDIKSITVSKQVLKPWKLTKTVVHILIVRWPQQTNSCHVLVLKCHTFHVVFFTPYSKQNKYMLFRLI